MGKTIVTLVNSGFLEGGAWDEEYEGIVSGWALALALLKLYVELYFGSPKSTLLLVQPAAFEYPRLAPLFSTAEGLSSWLASRVEMGPPGTACAFVFDDGVTLNGRVLAASRREVACSWPELDGAFELKAFRTGEGRVVGLRITSWGRGDTWKAAARARFTPALERLARRLAAEGATS